MDKPTFEELRLRLERIRAKDDYDDRDACCWQGYLAALLEWDLITPNDHKQLSEFVPVLDRDPSEAIFLGQFVAPKGIGPDDMIPDGISFDIANPKYRQFKSGDDILEYTLERGEITVDWVCWSSDSKSNPLEWDLG